MGSGFFSHFTSELLSTDFDEERLKNNLRASQDRGLSDPTGSGVRRDRINDLRALYQKTCPRGKSSKQE